MIKLPIYLCIAITISLSSCSPIKGYPGNVLAPEHLAHVIFSGGDVDTSDETVNRIPLVWHDRIDVLPGSQTASFAYSFNTDDDTDQLLGLTWGKSGVCTISFYANENMQYFVGTDLSDQGTYFSNPSVTTYVTQKSADQTFSGTVVARQPCTYGGRGVSVITKPIIK